MRIMDVEGTKKNLRALIMGNKKSIPVKVLAEEMGVTLNTVYYWASMNRSMLPTVDNFILLAGIYNKSLDEIIATKEI